MVASLPGTFPKCDRSDSLLGYLPKVEFRYFEIRLLFCFQKYTVVKYFKK